MLDGRTLELSFNPILVDGKSTGVSVFGKDITPRKQAEQELAASETRFRTFFEENGSVMFLADPLTGEIVAANRTACEFYGYPKERLVGMFTHQINVGPSENCLLDRQRALNGECTCFFYSNRLASGEVRDIELHSTPFEVQGRQLLYAIVNDITERKRTEAALRESLDALEEAQIIGGLGSYALNITTGEWTSSAMLDDIFGIGMEYEHNVAGWEALIHPADRAAVVAYFNDEVLAARKDFDKEYRIVRHSDGAERWLHGMGKLEFDAQGKPQMMRGVIKDITARKLAEIHIRESEERYRAVFQTSLDAVMISQMSDGMILDANQSFLDSSGFERNEVVGHTTQELGLWVNERDKQKFADILLRDGMCRDFEVLSKRKNGEIFWMRLSASLIEIGGETCRLTFAKEITEVKAAEARMAAAANSLRLSEERYRTAFQTSLDAIHINRLSDGKYIDVNQAFLDTMGFERDEVLDRTSTEVEIWANPRDRHTMAELIKQNLSCRGLEVQLKRKNGQIFWGEMSASAMELNGVPCILCITRDLSSSKAAEIEIRNLAFYDPLTGLPNRRLLLERLRQTLADNARSEGLRALLVVDLDNFKTLNDTLGHSTGDLLLKEVARRIAACAREADTVCRLGSDEFVLMLEDQGEDAEEAAAQAKAAAEQILAAIGQPYRIEGRECLSAASIGITVFGVSQNSTEYILQQADIALHQAKAAGGGALRFFSPALQASVNARASLEEELRQAIKANQFLLYYQPQVERGRVAGAEALIRWMHPSRGIVPPNDFIPVTEESRLILPLGDWVLEAACAQIAAWARRKQRAYLTVAVNISALQFRQPDFVEHVLAALERTGANPKNLKLELTESMLVDNFEEVIAKMSELKAHGLSFSLDDFGTGYSSLTYLKRLPLDQLKIDRVFVHDMLVDVTSGAIAQTIISLGRAMDLSVVAEGVETDQQRGFLAGLGCHNFQGYLFSCPLPLDEFERFLETFS